MINFCTIVDGQNGSIETVNTWVVGWPPSGTNRPQLPLVGYLVLTSDARPYPKPVNLGVWASFNPFEPELVLWFFNNFFLGPKCAYILHFNSKTHLVFVLGVKCILEFIWKKVRVRNANSHDFLIKLTLRMGHYVTSTTIKFILCLKQLFNIKLNSERRVWKQFVKKNNGAGQWREELNVTMYYPVFGSQTFF